MNGAVVDTRRALIVVDVQPTFCEGGELPVEGGNAVAEAIAAHVRLTVAGLPGSDLHGERSWLVLPWARILSLAAGSADAVRTTAGRRSEPRRDC